ncbi:glycosyltransferase 87 family protein [Kribbella sp. NBC_01245]|uniref:glycosyltransferase 87 family protein n=1 Tax=Kribbella sp. NBC_01245 TaxID=2903578 RepID=UPI002E294C2A|nr:glycosyltransferase 87 family protein [Kribbella sp. NBC_01245]
MTLSPAPDLRLQIDRIKRLSLSRKLGYGAVVAALLGVCLAVWGPAHPMYDLRVYLVAADALLHGEDIYSAHLLHPGMALGFTYPPFAVLLFAPFALIGTGAARVAITSLSVVSLIAIGQMSVRAANRSLGLRHSSRLGWSRHRLVLVALACGVAGLAFEPVRMTFHLGQINLILLAMLMLDLLGYTPRRFRGALIGIATGIKLTPGLFIIYLLACRRYREAAVASGVTAGTIVLGGILMPLQSTDYFTRYMLDPDRPGISYMIANQSIRGVFTRVLGDNALTGTLWPVAAVVTCLLGVLAARQVHDRGYPFESVLLVFLTTGLVSPISWTGHFVYALPVTIALAAWIYRTQGPVRHALTLIGVFWTASLTLGLPWWAPHFDDLELTHRSYNLVLANSYAIGTAAILAFALLLSRPRQSPLRIGVGGLVKS